MIVIVVIVVIMVHDLLRMVTLIPMRPVMMVMAMVVLMTALMVTMTIDRLRSCSANGTFNVFENRGYPLLRLCPSPPHPIPAFSFPVWTGFYIIAKNIHARWTRHSGNFKCWPSAGGLRVPRLPKNSPLHVIMYSVICSLICKDGLDAYFNVSIWLFPNQAMLERVLTQYL